jgi:hypothetical protein
MLEPKRKIDGLKTRIMSVEAEELQFGNKKFRSRKKVDLYNVMCTDPLLQILQNNQDIIFSQNLDFEDAERIHPRDLTTIPLSSRLLPTFNEKALIATRALGVTNLQNRENRDRES